MSSETTLRHAMPQTSAWAGAFLQWQVGFFTIIVQPTFALLAELQHRVKARAPSGVIVFW